VSYTIKKRALEENAFKVEVPKPVEKKEEVKTWKSYLWFLIPSVVILTVLIYVIIRLLKAKNKKFW
jgi:hypothetical protein